MSASQSGPDRQRLLPATVEHSLNETGIRVAGGALVAYAASSWLALLSWQMRDGGSGSAGKAGRNLLGTFGAGLSDMMVHTLGIAVVFALICPMVWGLEMLSGVRWIARFKLKLIAAVSAVLALAGLASGLPPVPGWPLLGGSGGMIGDLVHTLAAALLQRLGIERHLFINAILAAVGLFLLLKSLGISLAIGGPVRRKVSSSEPAVRSDPVESVVLEPEAAGAVPPKQGANLDDTGPKPSHSRDAVSEPETPRAEPRSAAPARVSSGAGEGEEARAMPDREEEAARAFAERFAPGIATGKPKERKRFVQAAIEATLNPARAQAPAYRKPSINLLRRGAQVAGSDADLEAGAARLMEVLGSFGVRGEIRGARSGPVVSCYELEPARGTQISRVIGLADDFAQELGVAAVRVSLMANRTTIGIEVPNRVRETVALRDILESDAFGTNSMHLPVALGRGIGGEPVAIDLARMPHLLVAGTTASGRSQGLDALILSLIYHLDPAELRFLLVAPRRLELAQFQSIPHLLAPVVSDVGEAILVLEWAVAEMDERYRRMAQQSTRNIEAFNAKVRAARTTGIALTRTVQTGFEARSGRAIYERQQLDDDPLPYIVIVVDELADLMVGAGRRVEGLVQRLAEKARPAGIHLVIATERPSADVVTSTIKAAMPVRLCYRVANKIESRLFIGEPGGEQLLGHGDMLLTTTAGSGAHLRVHGVHVGDEEVARVTDSLRDQGRPQYVMLGGHGPHSSLSALVPGSDERALGNALDPEALYAAAVEVVAGDRKVSPGHLHRRMAIPEDVASSLIARMEREGLVSAPNVLGRRAINIEPAAKPRPGARTAA